VLYVSEAQQLLLASERQLKFGDPFPELFAVGLENAEIALPDEPEVHIFSNHVFSMRVRPAISLSADTALILINGRCEGGIIEYAIRGALYAIRFGPRTSLENCFAVFDLLIARHIQSCT
jgi:hypothetical protein